MQENGLLRRTSTFMKLRPASVAILSASLLLVSGLAEADGPLEPATPPVNARATSGPDEGQVSISWGANPDFPVAGNRFRLYAKDRSSFDLRSDDGSAEAHIDVDQGDRIQKYLFYPAEIARYVDMANIWIYGTAKGCQSQTPVRSVLATGLGITGIYFDPCQVFPTTSAAWRSFRVYPEDLAPGGWNMLSLYHEFSWYPSKPVSVGIDRTQIHGRDEIWSKGSGYAGNAMIYLELIGQIPYGGEPVAETTDLSVIESGLAAGSRRFYWVVGVNEHGEGPHSDLTEAIVP